MRKWFSKQIEKLGGHSASFKTTAAVQGRFLESGQSQNILFPKELDNQGEWRIKAWLFEKGQVVSPGAVIGLVENKKEQLEFETFVGGKLNYFKKVGQRVEGGSIVAEITGV